MFFTRRRVQNMLDELSLSECDRQELVKRLNTHSNAREIYASVWEAAILWSLSKQGAAFEAYPPWLDSDKVPEAYTEHLFPGRPCVVEVKSVSDGNLSGKDAMRSVSAQISAEANKIKKGSGGRIFFWFHEQNIAGIRTRMVRSPFKMDGNRSRLENWILSDPVMPKVSLFDGNNSVTLEWRTERHPRSNFHSSMPPEARHLERNPIVPALKDAKRQLAGVADGVLRCVVVCDAGSRFLSDPTKRDGLRSHSFGPIPVGANLNAKEIIESYIEKRPGIDVVIVISAREGSLMSNPRRRFWGAVQITRSSAAELPHDAAANLVALLPPPRVNPWSWRQAVDNGAYDPSDVQLQNWVGASVTAERERSTMKISRNILFSYIEGKIDYDEFCRLSGYKGMSFGMNIRDIRLVSGGLDADDDVVELEMGKDPTSSAFE